MGKLAALGATLLGALALAAPAGAVTLVTPQGQPVGGVWQQWADESKVPTVTGTVVLDDAAQHCGGPAGCSIPGEVYVAFGLPPKAEQSTLYFELGHLFDWQYLTGWRRRFLAREWQATRYRWADSIPAIQNGWEDGLEGVFPMIYADCAVGIDDKGAFVGGMEPVTLHFADPNAQPRIDTCKYLRRWAR